MHGQNLCNDLLLLRTHGKQDFLPWFAHALPTKGGTAATVALLSSGVAGGSAIATFLGRPRGFFAAAQAADGGDSLFDSSTGAVFFARGFRGVVGFLGVVVFLVWGRQWASIAFW
jgi:hypothetical protein